MVGNATRFLQEYIEPEDVFDLNPKQSAEVQGNATDMEVDVDIVTLDKVPIQYTPNSWSSTISVFLTYMIKYHLCFGRLWLLQMILKL